MTNACGRKGGMPGTWMPGPNMGEKIRIGSWQGPVEENNVRKNLDKVKSVLEQAGNLKLDFICFPETFLTGITQQAVKESSISLDGPEMRELLEYSKGFDTVVLVGASLKIDGKYYNSQIVLHKGNLLGISHKTMLTEEDSRIFSTDLNLPVYEAKGVKFGVAICHTTSFVEPALYLRWKGARLLFTPHYNNIPPEGFMTSSGERVTFWEHRTMVLNNQAALATLLKMVVVRSNIVTIGGKGLGSGDSNIWDMNGNLVAGGVPFTECLVSAEFDKKIFLEEHWISRREVPAELCEMIAEAARKYPR